MLEGPKHWIRACPGLLGPLSISIDDRSLPHKRMKPFLRQQLARYADRLGELEFLLSRQDIMSDMAQFLQLSREHTEVAAVAGRWLRYQQREADLAEAQDLLKSAGDDADMTVMAQEEIDAATVELQQLEAELQRMLLPKDPDDARPAFVEIRAGTGGDESALFAADLARMYLRYCDRKGWRHEIISESPSELGGYKEIVIRVEGDNAYGTLKFESGGHRVQRVPVTETQGRIHTSACTVAVLAEPDEAEAIKINPSDLRIDTYRASGARSQGIGRAQEPDRQRRPQRPHPNLQLPAGPPDRPPHQPDAVQAAGDHGRRSGGRGQRTAGTRGSATTGCTGTQWLTRTRWRRRRSRCNSGGLSGSTRSCCCCMCWGEPRHSAVGC